ncbi:MAG: CvpA family protein [Flavisolibacter sp.]
MNYIDIILMLILALAIWAGWKRGFIMGSVNLLVWIGSLVAGFVFYPYLVQLLQAYLPGLGVWNTPLSFIIIIILARIMLAFIFNTFLSKTPDKVHTHEANRFMGIIPGAINGLIYATIVAALLLSMPLRSGLSDNTRDSAIANTLGMNIGWLDDKLSPIFSEAIRKSLTGATIQPESEETVNLNFKVENARARPDLEARMLTLVNIERMKQGLKPVKADDELRVVARAHSQDMFARGYFSHYTPEGRDPFDRMKSAGVNYMAAGENLALGQTLKICHDGLMNSPGHRANILNASYGRLGIGILDGGTYGLMISQEFRN